MSILTNNNYQVAAYIRLSKEDEKIGESESITNQQSLLLRYIKENNYNLYDLYIDDGFSGTNFDRPEFQRMLNDIEAGKINMVITKDLSRLGRDYIGTGEFIEKYFPSHSIRYLALTDNIDTALDNTNNDIAPFKAIMNDYYAKDISKKIRASLHTKQRDGKWVGGCPPFGYMQEQDNKNHLIPNPKEAKIVKKIFSLAKQGMSTYAIKEYLIDNKIETPSMIRKINKPNTYSQKGIWNTKTIKTILTNELYTGDLVQNRRSKLNYKIKKIVYNSRDKWVIVPNTHEAIISKEDFNNVQTILKKIVKNSKKKEKRLLDGLLYCFECQHKITICQPRKSDNRTYIVCNYYRMHSKEQLCTSHAFNYDMLEKNVIEAIIEAIKTNIDINALAKRIMPRCRSKSHKKDISEIIATLDQEITNITSNLDKMYIDKLENKISEEMYIRVSTNLKEQIGKKEKEKSKFQKAVEKTQAKILTNKDVENIINNLIMSKILTREMLINLIDYIAIHKDKQIDIHFNFNELNFLIPKL